MRRFWSVPVLWDPGWMLQPGSGFGVRGNPTALNATLKRPRSPKTLNRNPEASEAWLCTLSPELYRNLHRKTLMPTSRPNT